MKIVLFDRDINLGTVVITRFVLGHVGATDHARQHQRRDQPEDHDHGQQLHERERQAKCWWSDSFQHAIRARIPRATNRVSGTKCSTWSSFFNNTLRIKAGIWICLIATIKAVLSTAIGLDIQPSKRSPSYNFGNLTRYLPQATYNWMVPSFAAR